MIYYKHFIGDFQRDTGHLSLTERGAYRSLLDHYYATERALPFDMTQLCRIVGAVSKADRDAVKRVLEEFWRRSEQGWTNDRADKELAKSDEQRETNRRIAEAREAKRRAARQEHEPSTTRATTRDTNRATNRSTNDQPIHSHSHSHSQSSEDLPLKPLSNSCVISSLPVAKVARAESEQRSHIDAIKALYPPHSGRTDWITAEHHIRRHVELGATWEDLRAGVERYAAHVQATNRMVLNPARFFGDGDRPWSQPWPIPPTKAQKAQDTNVAAAQAWLERANAAG